MKKLLFFLISCLSLFIACDKDNLVPICEKPFDIIIEQTACFNGGVLLSVNLPNPEEYEYLWEVNGVEGSHGQQTHGCQCIIHAKIQVTRLSDGNSSIKELQDVSGCPSNK